MLPRYYELAFYYNKLVSRNNELVSRYREQVLCLNELCLIMSRTLFFNMAFVYKDLFEFYKTRTCLTIMIMCSDLRIFVLL